MGTGASLNVSSRRESFSKMTMAEFHEALHLEQRLPLDLTDLGGDAEKVSAELKRLRTLVHALDTDALAGMYKSEFQVLLEKRSGREAAVLLRTLNIGRSKTGLEDKANKEYDAQDKVMSLEGVSDVVAVMVAEKSDLFVLRFAFQWIHEHWVNGETLLSVDGAGGAILSGIETCLENPSNTEYSAAMFHIVLLFAELAEDEYAQKWLTDQTHANEVLVKLHSWLVANKAMFAPSMQIDAVVDPEHVAHAGHNSSRDLVSKGSIHASGLAIKMLSQHLGLEAAPDGEHSEAAEKVALAANLGGVAAVVELMKTTMHGRERTNLLIDLHAYIRLRSGEFSYEEVLPVVRVMLMHLAKADPTDEAYPACMYQAIHLLTDISAQHHARVENVVTSVPDGPQTLAAMLEWADVHDDMFENSLHEAIEQSELRAKDGADEITNMTLAGKWVVTACKRLKSVRVRALPNCKAKALGAFKRDEIIDVYGFSEDKHWVKVLFDGKVAWVKIRSKATGPPLLTEGKLGSDGSYSFAE